MARDKTSTFWSVKPVERYNRLAEENLRRVFDIILPEERLEDLKNINHEGIENESENCTLRQSV